MVGIPRFTQLATLFCNRLQTLLNSLGHTFFDRGRDLRFQIKRSLAAKRDSRARMQLRDDDLLDDASYQEALASLDRTWRQFVALTIWESYLVGFRSKRTFRPEAL